MITDEQVRAALAAFNKAVNEPVMLKCERCDGRGYHHGFGEDGHDPDWCDVCGGGQYVVAPGEEGRAMRLALEAAALSTVPSAGADAVAWRFRWVYPNTGQPTSWAVTDNELVAKQREDDGWEVVPLYTHPPASEAQVRRTVKLLEWKQGDEDAAYHFAQSFIENYIITEFADDGLQFRLLGTSQYGVWFYNLGDAKAAAQADYERRVLSALTTEQGETATSPETQTEVWKPQRWMGPEQLARQRDDTHEEAMSTILAAADVATLSYEEAALGYARARGFIRDDADMMCSPLKGGDHG